MEHKHLWQTRYITIEGVDCASGVCCECGKIIEQYQVEDAINALQDIADNPFLSAELKYRLPIVAGELRKKPRAPLNSDVR